ncbi:transcription initiation factor IIB [Halobaculum lipolyticum]|nr:transcription initiation factor IIB family protein [Halobaculum sp. DT31]
MNTVEVVCDDCGLILAETTVDLGAEWRSFTDEPSRSRVGPPKTPARHDRGLSTEIGRGRDGVGRTLDGKTRRRLSRLRREHSRGRFQSKAERNQAYGFTEIRRMVGALGLGTALRDQACRLFSSAQDAGLFPGRTLEGMAGAAVYGVCRCTARSETLGDIVEVSRAERRQIRTAYRTLNTELGLPAAPRTPETFLPKLVSALDLPQAVERRARRLLATADDATIASGGNPAGIAGGAILVAASEVGVREHFTQKAVASLADVTPLTVRTHRDALRVVCEKSATQPDVGQTRVSSD